MDEGVQAPEAQGTDQQGGMFDDYLSSVPDNAREPVSNYLKDAERNVNGRLQEATEFRKQWEPYQSAGVDRYDPESLQQLLDWHQHVTSSDDGFVNWLQEVAPDMGLTVQQQQQIEQQYDDGTVSERDEIERLVAERLAPIEQRFQQQEQERSTNELAGEIRSTLDRLHDEHRDLFQGISAEQAEQLDQKILKLGMDHDGDDWIERGFQELSDIIATSQRNFIADKTSAPTGAVQGRSGGFEQAKPVTSFEEARAHGLERLRQSHQ